MIIPKPKTYREEGTLPISANVAFDAELIFCKKAFFRLVKKIYGVRLHEGEGGLAVKMEEKLPQNAYRIEGATVYASDVEGASYGLSTMLQLMEKSEDGFCLKNTCIEDAPDKDYRALMVDLARQWHEFEVVLGYVDLCYLNKVRYLQLHFTDNQSITYPFLDFPAAPTEGRSYTREEINYLVEYAHEAQVELVPEFEGIGHSRELIRHCPEAFGNTYDVKTDIQSAFLKYDEDGNLIDNVMCIGRKGIFNNIRLMIQDYAETFRYSQYIHIGCDEAVHKVWENCVCCRDYMERQRIDTTKKLYSHFVQKIVDITLSLSKTPIVWEGFPYEGTENISRDALVVAWESYYQIAPELLDSGFDIINAAWKPLYIVPPRHTGAQWSVAEENWNVYNWQHWIPASRACATPINVEPTEHVLGGMLCQWECTPEEERDKVLTNLPELSDRTWNVEGFYSAEEIKAAREKLLAIEEAVY